MKTVIQIFYGTGLTVGASLALGSLLLARLRSEFRRLEFALFSFLLGSAALSLLVFLLGTVHLASRGVFQILGLALIAAAMWRHRQQVGEPFAELPPVWLVLFWRGAGIYAILYLLHALSPEVSPDGTGYHLDIVAQYARVHGLMAIPTNMYASLSEGLEMLFLMAYTFGRHSAAALVHCSFLLALPLLLMSYGRRFGFVGAGTFAAVAAFTCPLMGVDGVSAYNDVALATVAFGVFYLLELWDRSRNAALLPLVGVLAGFCYALKYTGALVVPAAIAYVIWRQRAHSRREWLKSGLMVSLGATLLVAPWMLKDWIWVGNPLAPFFNAWFPNPYIHLSFEQGYRAIFANKMLDGSSRLCGLWDALVSGCQSQGAIGPLFVLSPLALLGWRRVEVRLLLVAALVLSPGYVGNFGGRFLLPLVPFVALALGMVLSKVRFLTPVLAGVQLAIALPGVQGMYLHPYAWKLEWPSVEAAFRIQPEEEFLAKKLPTYPLVRHLEAVLPGVQTIYATDDVAHCYTRHRFLRSYAAAFNEELGDMLKVAVQPPETTLREWRFRFAPRSLRRLRVTAKSPSASSWCIQELRVWRGGGELARQPGWRLDARPNPWGVALAFDNSYATRWCTWEPVKSGMHVDIDFGAPLDVDMVTLEADSDQSATLSSEGLAEKAEAEPLRKVSGLRRAAMEEFKARGVGYVLIKDTQDIAEDFFRNKRSWGVTELIEMAGYRVYRIE